jgi:hypothetical protein
MMLDVLTSHLQNRPAVRAALGSYRRSLFAWWLLQHDTGRHVSCLPLCRLNFETLANQDWLFRTLRLAESCEWPRKETLCYQLKIRSLTKRSRFCGRAATWALGTSITLEEYLAHLPAPLRLTLTFAPFPSFLPLRQRPLDLSQSRQPAVIALSIASTHLGVFPVLTLPNPQSSTKLHIHQQIRNVFPVARSDPYARCASLRPGRWPPSNNTIPRHLRSPAVRCPNLVRRL